MAFKITSFKHLRVRAVVLLIIAIPALTGYPLSVWTTGRSKMEVLTAWLDYAIIVNILIIYEVGFQQWLFFFAFASVVGTFIILFGALWSFIFAICRDFYGAAKGVLGYDSLEQMSIMICVIPLALFAARSFPPFEILDRLLSRKTKPSFWTKGFIFACRMLTHVTEIVVESFHLWREEMPALVKPRYTMVHDSNPFKFVKNRFIDSIQACCRVLLIRAFEPVPTFWEEIKAIGEIEPQE